jgi:aspartate carbamoyltransferase regulatory subunit
MNLVVTLVDPEQDKMKVKKIENGVVIDHIPKGKGLAVLSILGIDEGFHATVSMVMNTPSTSMGLKDIIKIEERALEEKEINKIALIAPAATVNFVHDYQIVKKRKISVPDSFEDVIRCPNPKCISNKEGRPLLKVERKSPLHVRCAYCERAYSQEELLELASFTA